MVVSVSELIGVSKKSFEDAMGQAVRRASKTVRNITGVDMLGQSAVIKDGKVDEYRCHCKIAFIVEEK